MNYAEEVNDTYGSKTWFSACGVLDVEIYAAADNCGDEAIISLLAGSNVWKVANDRRIMKGCRGKWLGVYMAYSKLNKHVACRSRVRWGGNEG
jgi:hypothetical protein